MERLNMYHVNPDIMQKMMELENGVRNSSIPKRLLQLIKMRASQLNGCGFCLDMHSKEAREAGESEQRLYVLSGWRHSRLYEPQEKAVLQLTEAMTTLPGQDVPDDVYREAAEHFDDKQLSEIIMAIVVINSWNRLAIVQGFKAPAPELSKDE